MASILVLEDDPQFSTTLVDLLSQFYDTVVPAVSAAEALESARRQKFHLILTDVRIAGEVDGVSALQAIQAMQPKIRSIIMTGFSDTEVPIRAARLQADDYLQKPFRLNALLDSIAAILEREPPIPRLFQRLLSLPAGAAQKAMRLLYDAQLQQLNQAREECLQRFFLLARAERFQRDRAYYGFCRWEQLELEYLKENHATAKRLTEDYLDLAESWLEHPPLESATISPAAFLQLYLKINAGRVDPLHLSRAILLLHQPESRRENVKAYSTYHWLWSEPTADEDPFVGLILENYTLRAARQQAHVRLYQADHLTHPKPGDRVLCLPVGPESQPLVRQELESARATLLHTGMGHYFLLYRGHSLSLRAHLPADGLAPAEAWKRLRPVFLQVLKYHQEGRASGSFSLRDIDVVPGQDWQLSHFSDQAYRAQHEQLISHKAILSELFSAPEVTHQPLPGPASDQAVLGRILFETILGGVYPDPHTRLHLRMLGEPEANQHFRAYLGRLGPLSSAFYRLCHHQPSQRFPSLSEAVRAIDSVFTSGVDKNS